MPMNYSDELISFVQAWEGLKLIPSGDPLVPGIVDVGYGHVIRPGEKRRSVTHEEAYELLCWDLNIVSDGVNSLVIRPLLQHQHDALCSFAFNVGLDKDDDAIAEGLGDSTLLKYVNAQMWSAAAAQFTLWVFASGHRVKGLERRRVAEQAMFVSGDYSGRP